MCMSPVAKQLKNYESPHEGSSSSDEDEDEMVLKVYKGLVQKMIDKEME